MGSARTIECDDSRWPLVDVSFHGSLREDDFNHYLRFLASCHDKRRTWALLLDGSCVRGVSALQRKVMADFLHEHEALARRHCVGTAFVLESPLVRGTLTAALWFQKQPTPYVIVGTREQALTWLHEKLDNQQATPPRSPQR